MRKLLILAVLLPGLGFAAPSRDIPPATDTSKPEDLERDLRRVSENVMPRAGGDKLTYRDTKNNRIGVGTTDPSCTLDVVGDGCFSTLTVATLTVTNSFSEFASGTKMVFYQATCPTSWTLVGSIGDKFLRVSTSTTNGGTTGGTMAASTTLVHHHATADHTLTVSEIPAHHHASANSGFLTPTGGSGAFVGGGSGGSVTDTSDTGGGQPHNHGDTTDAFTGGFAYADVIICAKN